MMKKIIFLILATMLFISCDDINSSNEDKISNIKHSVVLLAEKQFESNTLITQKIVITVLEQGKEYVFEKTIDNQIKCTNIYTIDYPTDMLVILILVCLMCILITIRICTHN